MADTTLNGNLPREVTLNTDDSRIGFTPRELDLIKERFGQTLTQIIADPELGDEKLLALAWLKLRRDGHAVTWDDMREIVVWMGDEPPDPTSVPPPATSPASVASGE
jgi:hypothetical protein